MKWGGHTILMALAATLSACSSGGTRPSPQPKKVCVVEWSAIGEDESGSPLSAPTSYRLEYGLAQSGLFNARLSVPAGASRYVLRAANGRSWSVRLIALSAERGESEPSNVATCHL